MQVANKHLERADRLLQKGKLEAALSEFLLAWKEEPANDAIVYTVAQLYQRLSKLKESRECYLFLYDKAVEKGDWQRVLELLRNLQVLGPVEPSRVMAAAHLLEERRPEVASEQYHRLLQSSGEQNSELVLQCLQGLTRLDPDSMDLHRRLSVIAERLGDTAAAVSSWRRSASLCLAAGKTAEQAEALEQVCRLNPNDQEARISLAQVYLSAGQSLKIPPLFEGSPQAAESQEVLALLAQAYLAAHELSKAEELYWKGLEKLPGAAGALLKIAKVYEAEGQFDLLSALLGRLEERLGTVKSPKQLIPLAEGLTKLDYQDAAFLDRLVRVFERLHLDTPLTAVLNTLFDIHFQAARFQQAAGILERIAVVEPYNPQSTARLERLKDHLDASQLRELEVRLGIQPPAAEEPAAGAVRGAAGSESESESSGASLQDLMLQAEIFLQYGMQDKANEKLTRIRSLFPDEEQHNAELTRLLERAGFSLDAAAAEPAAADGAAAAGEQLHTQPDLKNISEITRNISRQGTAKAVLSAAVNGIGKHWQLSRCVAGLAAPKRPPSVVLEYLSPGVLPSNATQLGKLVAGLQQAAPGKLLAAEHAQQLPALSFLQETLAALQVESLVCIPLRDGEQEMGVLILEQCGATRRWKPSDLTALEGIAEQVVLAVSNVRLRSLVKALAVTDERSGVLGRDSYLTCLLSEAEHMRTQKTPLAVVLLGFARSRGVTSRGDDPAVRPATSDERYLEEVIRKFSSAAAAHLRQNDIAVRYASDKLALILPGATGQDAAKVAEKLRKLVHAIPAKNEPGPPLVTAGIAEAARDDSMDSTDRITELVNRLEWAFEATRQAGGNQVKLLEPPVFPRGTARGQESAG